MRTFTASSPVSAAVLARHLDLNPPIVIHLPVSFDEQEVV